MARRERERGLDDDDDDLGHPWLSVFLLLICFARHEETSFIAKIDARAHRGGKGEKDKAVRAKKKEKKKTSNQRTKTQECDTSSAC